MDRHYLSKPVDPPELSDMLEKWTTKRDAFPKEQTAVQKPEPLKELFDRTRLLDRLMGDEDLAIKILGEFLEDVPHKFVALKQSLDSGDATSVQHQAHTLKGASAIVGAESLQEMACRLEAAGRLGDLDMAGLLVSQMEEHFKILKPEMRGAGRTPTGVDGT